MTVTGSYGSGNNVPLLFSGGNTQTFNLTGGTGAFDANITVNKSGGQINLSSDLVLDAGNNLTLTAGTLNLNGRTVTVDCSTCDPRSGTVSVGGTVTIAGTGTLAPYTYTQSGSSSMAFSGASAFTVGAGGFSLSTGTFTPNNATVTISGACTIDNAATFNAPPGNMTVGGVFTLTSGTFYAATGNVTVSGFVLSSGTYNGPTGNMTVNGNFSVSNGTFNAPGGYLDINGSFTLSSGEFNAPTGNMYVSGSWTHTAGGTFNNNNGAVILDGGYGVTIDVNSTETFYNLTLNKAASSWYMFIANNDVLRVTGAQAGGKAQLVISQYLKPGDSLTIDMDTAANRLLGLGVNSYLDKPDDPVTLAVQMSTLPDGALYAAQTTLDAKAKNIRVVVQNSGHRPVSQ